MRFTPNPQRCIMWNSIDGGLDKPVTWTLFRRQLLDEEEVHPWNMGGGNINEYEHAIDMNTVSFLKFMVDALNEKAARKEPYEHQIKEAEKRIYG